MDLVVETDRGELLAAVGGHALLAKRLVRAFAAVLGRACRIRDRGPGAMFSAEALRRSLNPTS